MMARRTWRRCPACGGSCHWHEDHWVCDYDPVDYAGCGAEWNSDHDPKFMAPGDVR